jgi:MarR family transcriptional regulator, lower aerobic nicotinate degradation pathway regulator
MTHRSSILTVPTRELSAVDGLVQLSFLIQNALAARAAEFGISLIQTRLLGVLRDRAPSVNELAMLLDLDKSSVSGLITRAEERGLIERLSSADDGRVVVVRLTRKGRSLVGKISTNFEEEITTFLDLLPGGEAVSLASIVSELLVAHAAQHGIDLFAGVATLPKT